MGGAYSTYGGEEKCIWRRDLREGDNLEDPDLNVKIILRCIFTKWNGEACAALIWLRIGTGGGLLSMR